jgi:hypothetical protein
MALLERDGWTPDPAEGLLRDVRRMLADRINNRLTVLLALIDESRSSGEAIDPTATEVARGISATIQSLSLERLESWRAYYGETVLIEGRPPVCHVA